MDLIEYVQIFFLKRMLSGNMVKNVVADITGDHGLIRSIFII